MTPAQQAAIADATARLQKLSPAERDMRQLASFSPAEIAYMEQAGSAPGMVRPTDVEDINAEILRTKDPAARAVLIQELAKMTAAQPSGAAQAPAGGGSSLPAATAAPEASTPLAPAFQRAGGYGPVLAGVAQSAIKSGLGIKSLFTDLSDENKAVLAAIREEDDADPEGGWRTTGSVGAGLAEAAAPGVGLAKIIKFLPKALAPVAAGAATSGASGLALNPTEEQGTAARIVDKLQMAGKDAAAGAAFGFGGQLIRKGLTQPFRPSAEAEMLFRQGVSPTLQQGADSLPGRFVGGLTSGAFPTRERQAGEVADALLNRVTSGHGSATGGTGGDFLRMAKGHVSGLYDTIMGNKRFPISPTTRGEVAAAASALNRTGQFQNEAQKASQVVSNVMGDSPRNINVNNITLRDSYLTPLSKEAYAPGVSDELRRRIIAARDKLIEKARTQRLTPDEQRLLKQADILNFDVQRMREATTGGREKKGIELKKLMDAYEAHSMPGNTTGDDLIFPAGRVIGRQLNQDQSRTALVNAARAAGGLGSHAAMASMFGLPGVAATAGLYATSLAGQTPKGARFLLGQNDWQRRLAEQLRRAGPYGAGLGYAATQE